MQFSVFSTLAFAALALAQDLAFTSFPMTVTVGKPTELTYTASDINAPASIVLRQGPSTNLMTVMTITGAFNFSVKPILKRLTYTSNRQRYWRPLHLDPVVVPR